MGEQCYKAFRFRLYPNKEQSRRLVSTFGCVRFVYNHFLTRKKEHYEETGKTLSYSRCASELVSLKKEQQFLKEADSIALQQAIRHLENAFVNFFRNPQSGYPRYKSKKKHKDSYSTMCVNNNLRLEGRYLILPKVGKVKIRAHREIPDDGVLKSATISRTPTGAYYVSLLYEYKDVQEISGKASLNSEKAAGLDFSVPELFVSSEETLHSDPEFLHRYKKAQDKLRKEQKSLSRKTKFGKNWEKQRLKVAGIHEHIRNQRKDYLHKVSSQIANDWDIVCIEALDLKEMSCNELKLGKQVCDDGWRMFTEFLEYKLEGRGKKLIRVSKWYPSSRTCSSCGYINKELELKQRTWECPSCKKRHNRDKNAAVNIKREGLRLHMEKTA